MIEMDIVMGLIMILHTIGELTFHTSFTTTMAHIFHGLSTNLLSSYFNRWIRDHWFRQYNGIVRCCCGWFEGGSQPLYSRRIANRCDYRRHVTSSENLENCRDANEDHGMGFDDIGCDPAVEASQLNEPIPEDDNMCWEIKRFGYTEDGKSEICSHISPFPSVWFLNKISFCLHE